MNDGLEVAWAQKLLRNYEKNTTKIENLRSKKGSFEFREYFSRSLLQGFQPTTIIYNIYNNNLYPRNFRTAPHQCQIVFRFSDRTAPGPIKTEKYRTNSHWAVRGSSGAWIPAVHLFKDRPLSWGPSNFRQKTVHVTRYRPPSGEPSTFRQKTVHFTPGPSIFRQKTVHFLKDRPLSWGPSTFRQKTVHFTRYRPPSEGPSFFRRTVHFPSKDRPRYPVPFTFWRTVHFPSKDRPLYPRPSIFRQKAISYGMTYKLKCMC